MTAKLYNEKGEPVGELELPASVFAAPWNADLVHQALRVGLANRRKVLAHAKTREEVSGGGRKPWRQKGTGRARHGSIRSPIWKGGGVTHGSLKMRKFARGLPQKMRKAAVAMILAKKAKDGELAVFEKLSVPEGKTKHAAAVLTSLRTGKKRPISMLVLVAERDPAVTRALRNLDRVKLIAAAEANAVDLLNHKMVVVPKDALLVLEKSFALE